MTHTSYYNDCKTKVKTMIKDPKILKFWTQTGGKRKDLVASMSRIDVLTDICKNPKSTDAEKSKAIDELKNIFNKALMMSKQCKEYIEVRLIFMKMEDTLIECGFDPTNIKEAMVTEESAGER